MRIDRNYHIINVYVNTIDTLQNVVKHALEIGRGTI